MIIKPYEILPKGTITTPKGFLAGAIETGLKRKGGLDLALLFSKIPCKAVGLFTQNKIKAAPVLLSQKHLLKRKAQAIVVNSGCANALTGERGFKDAQEMASFTAQKLGISPEDVLVASTGVIGTFLPMERIREGIARISLSKEGGHNFALAIMTTDPFPKEIAVRGYIKDKEFFIGGVAKGAGMIHPNLATMLCFLTTDADVEWGLLKNSLKEAVNKSFNMITIDGETSPNDMVVILANGLAENEPLKERMPEAQIFKQALNEVCLYLAKEIVRGGEGATKLIEVKIEGAMDEREAKKAARAIASSPLVKTAIYGSDPNWGRILAALGRSGIKIKEEKIELYLRDICLFKEGSPLPFDKEEARFILSEKEVFIKVKLNIGEGSATAWGCDLTPDYVKINSEYST